MKTNIINELQQQGFDVKRTSKFTTVVTYDKPFNILGESGKIQALSIDNQYSVTFNSLCSKGLLPNDIEHLELPLLADLVQKRNKKINEKQTERPTYMTVKFADLMENQTFYKDTSAVSQYHKTGDCTYVKESDIAQDFQLIMSSDTEVLVEMDYSMLTPEQKNNIVTSLQKGLSDDQFVDQVSMQLENIAGMDTLNDKQLQQLYSELLNLYKSNG